MARERPKPPVVAITPNLATGRKLSAVWGVHCVVAEDAHDLDDMVGRACRLAFRDSFAKAGQRVIVVAGVPLGTPGATNMLRIAFVGAEAAREYVDQVPPVFGPRVLSLRGFDKDGMMTEAVLTQPGEADAGIRKLFDNPEVETIHAHNATRGCFAAKIERN